ncbi:MAG: LysR family transcriptional regulator [Deltaproteobacteria bacterium]|nr:LysR family transcriptional regulator [Deltaproteobacteria bacterium]MBI3295778.1 LysR family transcriptional regulator [Deltaproteobacteria bacterium]
MKWLNYHHLYYFRTIAKEGSIAGAARKLRLGQPTLSTQLKQLEDSLGRRLFERKNRALFLTAAGKICLEYADGIFRSGSELVQVLENSALSGRTDIKIGALDSVPKNLLVSLVGALLKEENCNISVLEGRADELFRELFSHQIDLLVTNFPPDMDSEKTYSISLAKASVSIFGAKKFSKLKRGFPACLDGQPFILPTRHSKLRHDLDHFFSVNRLRIIPIAETEDTSLQKLLGIEGFGLLPLPDFSVKDLVKSKTLSKLGTFQGVKEEFWLTSAVRKIENPLTTKIMKSFRFT